MSNGKCAVSYAGNRFVARLGNKFVTIIIPMPKCFVEIIDNVLTITGGSKAAVVNGVRVLDGRNVASIKDGVLVVE